MAFISNRASDSLEKRITLTGNEILSSIEGDLKNQQIVSLSNICAERTILSPAAFRLPPEILEVIFILGACNYYKSGCGFYTPCVPTWVNVSYICRHWRNVALNCPALWSYPFNISLRWMKELLLRSEHAPLRISIRPSYHQPEPISWPLTVLNEVLKHSARIQEHHLNLNIQPIFLPAELSFSTPHLKNLEIRLAPSDSNEFIVITDRDALRLHTLTLANCSLPWYLLNLSELKTLSLHHVCPFSQPTVDKFLAILSSMQHITVLDLEHSLPSASDFLSNGDLNISPRINLPHLTLLALVAPLSTVVALLSCVDIPLTTQIRLNLLMESGISVGDYALISSFLAKQFSTVEQSSGLAFRSLCLDVGQTPSLTFSLDCLPPSPREKVNSNIPLKITLSGFKDEGDSGLTRSEAHCIMRDICCSLPLANAECLHVLWPEFSANIWEDILGHMHGLCYMKLSHGTMPDLSLLSRVVHEPKENPAGQLISDQTPTPSHMVVPALEELELYDIEFASDCVWQNRGMTEKSLLDALYSRRALGSTDHDVLLLMR